MQHTIIFKQYFSWIEELYILIWNAENKIRMDYFISITVSNITYALRDSGKV